MRVSGRFPKRRGENTGGGECSEIGAKRELTLLCSCAHAHAPLLRRYYERRRQSVGARPPPHHAAQYSRQRPDKGRNGPVETARNTVASPRSVR